MKKVSSGITATLRNLKLYEKATFPKAKYKYSVINATIQRLQTESEPPVKFTQKKNKVNNTLEVIRTA